MKEQLKNELEKLGYTLQDLEAVLQEDVIKTANDSSGGNSLLSIDNIWKLLKGVGLAGVTIGAPVGLGIYGIQKGLREQDQRINQRKGELNVLNDAINKLKLNGVSQQNG